MSYGYPYRGQPSVVYSVPFTLGPAATYSTMTPVGFGSVDGTDANPGALHAMDGSITNDPQGAPGSGADRLRMSATQTSRLELEVRPCFEPRRRPRLRWSSPAEPVIDPKHSHEWGHLHFVVPAELGRRDLALRGPDQHRADPIVPGDAHVVHPGPARPGRDRRRPRG